jgi:hypothetical protein
MSASRYYRPIGLVDVNAVVVGMVAMHRRNPLGTYSSKEACRESLQAAACCVSASGISAHDEQGG